MKLNSRPTNLQIKNRINSSEVTVAHAVVARNLMCFPSAYPSAVSNNSSSHWISGQIKQSIRLNEIIVYTFADHMLLYCGILCSLARASWINVNNCPTRCDYIQFCCTGLFISPSGISEHDCATTKTDTAERSISIGRESLQVFFLY